MLIIKHRENHQIILEKDHNQSATFKQVKYYKKVNYYLKKILFPHKRILNKSNWDLNKFEKNTIK